MAIFGLGFWKSYEMPILLGSGASGRNSGIVPEGFSGGCAGFGVVCWPCGRPGLGSWGVLGIPGAPLGSLGFYWFPWAFLGGSLWELWGSGAAWVLWGFLGFSGLSSGTT